ncbi:MAG TPA: FAD-dependent oxidoreductase [Polyangiaceae bacterium]|jgi:oxygen-dependent protoporphyrinogen oxidase|nr:FAD-dependent oxidoreductase [Polyangiaceae bacterium]
MQRIAVVGGGIAGLTVALRRVRSGDSVVLFEANNRIGGQLRSESSDGFVVEHGAEGFVARSEAVPALANAIGIAHDFVDQLVFNSYRYDAGALVALAPGEAGRMLGFQVESEELGRGIRSFRHGMGELPESLLPSLDGPFELCLGTTVTRIAPGTHFITLDTSDGSVREFDAVAVAATANSAAAMLEQSFGAKASALRAAPLHSSVTVSLAFRRERVNHPLDGTGMIVPNPAELDGVRAVTFASSKLPERAPQNHVLLRAFFRPSAAELTHTDGAWKHRTERALARALAVLGAAEAAWISRWPDALPVFDDAQRLRIVELEQALAGHRIALAGSAFHGSGIDAAIRSAEKAALVLAGD